MGRNYKTVVDDCPTVKACNPSASDAAATKRTQAGVKENRRAAKLEAGGAGTGRAHLLLVAVAFPLLVAVAFPRFESLLHLRFWIDPQSIGHRLM